MGKRKDEKKRQQLIEQGKSMTALERFINRVPVEISPKTKAYLGQIMKKKWASGKKKS